MSRTPRKSRRWTPRVVVQPSQEQQQSGPSSHLGGQFGFAPTHWPTSVGTRGYARTVRA